MDRSPRCYALSLAEKLGYSGDTTDNSSLLAFLQGQSASSIVKASVMFMDWDYASPMPWTPSTDSFCSAPFLPERFSLAVLILIDIDFDFEIDIDIDKTSLMRVCR